MQKEQTPIDLSAKGSEALITRCGDFLYFGEFPQSLKAAGVSVNDNLTDERGYFFGSDGYYYARMRGAAISGNETFRNGSRIVPHEVYYFKVEPLRFRILEEKNGEALIVADRILTVLPFDASKNTYRESDIRTYLNGPFLKTAFTDEERELLLKTTIDNSPKSAGQARAKGKNAPTEDWIFLLSVEEVTSPQYALLWSKSVMNAKKVDYTDYTRAKGLPLTLDGYYERVPYWLRSADYQSDNRSFLVNGYTVSQSSETVTSHAVGVLPALRIRLDPEKIAIKASEEDELIIEITKKEQEEGAFVEEGEFVYFGEYPQTLKAPEVSVDKTKRDLRGYYLGSDGAWYESVGAGANGIVPLPSGQRVVKFHEYFLKVEPIRWRILEQEGSVATLVCDSILKSSIFSYDYNNYEKSHVRKWLNRWFYEKAFAESERKWILPTVVYNDERSVAGTNPYLSENTRDKLFLLSYTEATSLY